MVKEAKFKFTKKQLEALAAGRKRYWRRYWKAKKLPASLADNPKLIAFRNQIIHDFVRDSMFGGITKVGSPKWIEWARSQVRPQSMTEMG